MFPLSHQVPVEPAVVGWLFVIVAAAAALHSLRRGFLPTPSQQHAWLAGIVMLALLWTLQSKSRDGIDVGLCGSALFALVFGRERAVLGLVAALALHTVLANGSWVNFGVNGALLAVVPAWLAAALQRLLERLPRNLFIFIIGNGLFVTLLVTAVVSTSFVAVTVLIAGVASSTTELFAYSLLMAWGEALLSGMIFSALVVFVPGIVMTYRQDVYLPPRKRPF